MGHIYFPHDCFVFFFSPRYLSRFKRYNVDLFSHVFGFIRRSVWLSCLIWMALICGVIRKRKKLKIEIVGTGWNFQITRLTTRALRKNKNKKFFLCDLFYLFFADFSVFDITWTFKEWGQSNFAMKWGLFSRFRRHITRWPSFRNFLIRRLWSLVENQKWSFLSKLIRH